MQPSPRLSPAHAHNLERIDQLRPRQHPRRARAGDGVVRAPVGRAVQDAAPRVPDADQAEALVPGARRRALARRDRARLGGRRRGSSSRSRTRSSRRSRARHLARDRDPPVRARRRGRPDLLRPHLLPRSGRRPRRSAGRTRCCSRRCASRRRRLGSFVLAGKEKLCLIRAEGRRACARDALPRRGREEPGGDRRARRGDRGEEGGARARAADHRRARGRVRPGRAAAASTARGCASCSRRSSRAASSRPRRRAPRRRPSIDLMEALRASVAASQERAGAAPKKPAARRKRAAASRA